MKKIVEFLKIANIHRDRIKYALENINRLFPLSGSDVNTLKEKDFLFIELLTTRFSKLQDYIGQKLIDAFLEEKGEQFQGITMIDKLHRLEQLGFIDSADLWLEMREVRNHIAHEYPNHPEVTAEYLNRIYKLTPILLLFLEKIEGTV